MATLDLEAMLVVMVHPGGARPQLTAVPLHEEQAHGSAEQQGHGDVSGVVGSDVDPGERHGRGRDRGWVLLGRALTAITGWLRRRPGVRRAFPEPATIDTRTPAASAA